MVVLPDPRRMVVSAITAKYIHVKNNAECSRRYGPNKKEKMLQGTVVEVINIANQENRQKTTTVVGDYDIGEGTIKRATLHIQSIKLAEIFNNISPPPPPYPSPPPMPLPLPPVMPPVKQPPRSPV